MVKSKKKLVKKKEIKKNVKRKISKKISKVKKKSPNAGRRVSSGIPKFDEMIQGGFEKNSTNLLVGGSGTGKTIFAIQFLIEGMKKGENCLYVTFEEKKEQFYENMKAFGWNLEKYEKDGLFLFLEYTPVKVRNMLDEGGGAIENAILEKHVKRIVIDSITSFALLFEDDQSKRHAALSLFNMIRGWDCTALLTSEENVENFNLPSEALEFEADSITALYFLSRSKDERERFIEVIKMRGTEHSKKVYPVRIDKKGMSVGCGSVSRASFGK